MNTAEIEKLVSDVVKASPIRTPKPPGCWDLLGVKGSRDGVKKAIAEHPDIPVTDKVWLASKIDALATEFNSVEIHAYCHLSGGKWLYDCALTGTTQLL